MIESSTQAAKQNNRTINSYRLTHIKANAIKVDKCQYWQLTIGVFRRVDMYQDLPGRTGVDLHKTQ